MLDRFVRLSSGDVYRKREADVTFVVGFNGNEFDCHRAVLAAYSKVMNNMLYGSLREAHESRIKLEDFDEEAFAAFIECVYTGTLAVHMSFICNLIYLCDYYDVPCLVQCCCSWLHDNLVVDNMCEILKFASSFEISYPQFYKRCFKRIEDRAASVFITDGFLEHTTAEHMEKLATSNQLEATEIQLFEALRRWTEHDKRRREQGSRVAKCIRLPLLTPDQLRGPVSESNLIDSNAILEALASMEDTSECFTNPYQPDSPHITLRGR